MHPILLNIYNILLPTQVVGLFIGLLLGFVVLLHYGLRCGTHWKILVNSYLMVLFAGILGGRLLVLLLNIAWFREHPGQVWLLPIGGVNLYGALLGAFAVLWLVSLWYAYTYWRLTDIVVVAVSFVVPLFSVAAFFQGVGFGELTNVAFGVASPSSLSVMPLAFPRHPVQLYVGAAMLTFFLALQFLQPWKMFNGQFTALFLVAFPLSYELANMLSNAQLGLTLFKLPMMDLEVTVERLLGLFCVFLGALVFHQCKRRRLEDIY